MGRRLGIVAGLDVQPLALDAELADLLEARLEFARVRIEAYARRRSFIQSLSLVLRSLGAALLTVGAIFPALREAVPRLIESPMGGLAFGYVLLGLGAAALAVDRGFGLSRIGPRLAAAEVALAGAEELFLADWRIAGERPAPEARRQRLDLARAFTAEVNRIVRREVDRSGDLGSDS
ncbi:MAG TPA: SLATT domain-containing protein [Phenylobacterium sp.]|nr:SLATT domain-containing protein [Phenylobacterium sp.]